MVAGEVGSVWADETIGVGCYCNVGALEVELMVVSAEKEGPRDRVRTEEGIDATILANVFGAAEGVRLVRGRESDKGLRGM